MTDDRILGSRRKRALFSILLAAVVVLALAAAFRYATPLTGLPDTAAQRMDTGWFYEDGAELSPLPELPCRLEWDGDTLVLVRPLTEEEADPANVLVVETRYQSIRVWADQTLIYEAAQGQEHALSSMWHFIPAEDWSGSACLRIELVQYGGEAEWPLFSVRLDHPGAIAADLIREHLPILLVWLCCVLFTLLLAFVLLFMVVRHIKGSSLVLALAAFIFLSGTWILLDSKITTVVGGNYAVTYFLSYCVFYLMPLPLLFFCQILLELKNRLLRCLVWITAGNAGLWMLLHLLGVVSIRDTATSVHLIIILFLAALIWELLRRGENRRRLTCTLWGVLLIFVVALVSILMYYTNLLPPANSAVLFVWGLLALILCMIMDTMAMFGWVWKEKQYVEVYRQLATEDTMTLLGNRNAYELRMQELADHPGAEVCLILFDIDRMKQINDTYGHHTGDQVISLIARCIRDAFDGADGCYRIGGDEFCVIRTASDDVEERLGRFDRLIRENNSLPFSVAVSHGWESRCFEPDKPVAMQELTALKTAADQKLYRHKNARREEG